MCWTARAFPRLLVDCANEVEEADFNGDGETDLCWYYHGGAETYTYFRYGGRLYLAHSRSSLAQGLSTDPLPAIPAGDAVEDTGSPQLLPVSSIWGTTLPDEAFAAEREEFLNAELDQDAIRRNVRETSNLRLLQTLPEQGISLYGYSSENWHGYGLVFYLSGTQKLYRVPIIYADNHDELLEKIWDSQDVAFDLMTDYDALPHQYGEFTLYQAEAHLINLIASHPDITVTDIANILQKTPSACSQIVRKLHAKGWVEQRRNEANNRIFNLRLAPEGERVFHNHNAFDENCQRRTFEKLDSFTEKELEIYLKVQEQLNEAYEGDIQRMKAYFR